MSARYTLVIGNKNYSSWSMRPWVWMRHHSIDFTTHRIVLRTPATRTEIAAFGCGATVPVMVDGEAKVWDSLAILEYLAEQHPECQGWPADSASRAHARSVCAEMHSGFMPLRSAMPMNCRRTIEDFTVSGEVAGDVDRINRIFNDCRRRYSGGGSWLFGSYSIADAMFTPVVMRFNTYGIKLDGDAAAYLHTVSHQSSVLEWIEDSRQEKEVIESDEI